MADDWGNFPSDDEIAAELEAQRVRLEAEAKEAKRKKREDYRRRQRDDAEAWYDDEPAERVKLRDEGRDFGRVEKCCNVADGRATRYFSRCHRSAISFGHAPGGSAPSPRARVYM